MVTNNGFCTLLCHPAQQPILEVDLSLCRRQLHMFEEAYAKRWLRTGAVPDALPQQDPAPLSAEKYLREVWPAVTRALKEVGVGCELNLVSLLCSQIVCKMLLRALLEAPCQSWLYCPVQCIGVELHRLATSQFGRPAPAAPGPV